MTKLTRSRLFIADVQLFLEVSEGYAGKKYKHPYNRNTTVMYKYCNNMTCIGKIIFENSIISKDGWS
jgi:hypothetical protein